MKQTHVNGVTPRRLNWPPSMADPLQLQLPDRCPLCRESRSIGVEYMLKFRRVTMEWVCRLCAYRWPVETTELLLLGRPPTAS